MNEQNNNEVFDLGSEPIGSDFDPFAADGETAEETPVPQTQEEDPVSEQTEQAKTETGVTVPADGSTPVKAQESKAPKAEQGLEDKAPVFEYAGAKENIGDTSMTFDELRIEKSADFPELDDGKRVSWTIEYGKVTKSVADPKGTSVGKMKSDIEASKEFTDSLKKAKDKNPVCKVKPRVTAQSKGTVLSAYRGVFTNMEEAESSGKIISIVPGRDGKVYEIRRTETGKFITPVADGCEDLSEVRAGFIPALPLIPAELISRVMAFFRYFTRHGADKEVLVNIYWDKLHKAFVVDAPSQVVTSVSVDSGENLDYVNDRYIHYMDIHSHNSMRAFFSAVDNNDEKATRLYTVIGNLHEYFPDIKTRISNGGKFHEINPTEVFELVGRTFPEEWKESVRFRAPHGDHEADLRFDMDAADAL